jgi:competence protein ComEC
LSVLYYHLREPAGPVAALYATPVPMNSLLARAVAIFENTLPYRQASLLGGIISGSTTVLAPDVKLAMSQSGTSYIIGMYGYKIYLLAETVRATCRKFCSRGIALLFAFALIASFVAMANAPVSAFRAGIMAGFAMLAEASGKKFNARSALLFTAALIILFDPASFSSGGFLLSFMSLVGIYALAPPFKAALAAMNGDSGGDGVFAWRSHLTTTMAVNLAILPIASAMYGDFPAISFISNFLIAVPFGAVIALGIGLAILGGIFVATTIIITPILDILLSYQLLVIKISSGFAWSIPAWFMSPIAVVVYYSMLAWLAFHFASSVRISAISS